MTASSAISTPAPYIGGKRNLSRRLVAMIGTIPHRTYVEPFVGMGGVFLKRPAPAPAEVINDISGDVVTLFRVVRRHYEPLVDEIQFLFSSRDEFERQKRVDPTTLTDIERAARFLYLQRLAFGGKVSGRTFGVCNDRPSRFNPAQLRADLRKLRDRLAVVTIERLPYADVIRRYDSQSTLFYLDPPYWGCEDDYGQDVFSRDDFQRLVDQLAAIAGRFVLSINATDGARDVFSRFAIEEVGTTYTVGSGAAKPVRELIITNAR